MGIKSIIPGYIFVSMLVFEFFVIDYYRKCTACKFVVYFYYCLSFREFVNQGFYSFVRLLNMRIYVEKIIDRKYNYLIHDP